MWLKTIKIDYIKKKKFRMASIGSTLYFCRLKILKNLSLFHWNFQQNKMHNYFFPASLKLRSAGISRFFSYLLNRKLNMKTN